MVMECKGEKYNVNGEQMLIERLEPKTTAILSFDTMLSYHKSRSLSY